MHALLSKKDCFKHGRYYRTFGGVFKHMEIDDVRENGICKSEILEYREPYRFSNMKS